MILTSKVAVQLNQGLQVGVLRLWSLTVGGFNVLLGCVNFTHFERV